MTDTFATIRHWLSRRSRRQPRRFTCARPAAAKTVVATSIIERAVERGERVLMLTHRREILRQTSLKLAIDHGLIQAGLNIDLSYPVQVASVQTLWARCMRTDKSPLPPANLIIIDEAHHVGARTWRLILEAYPNARRIGLTATPCRSDGRGLGNYFDELILGPQIPDLIAQVSGEDDLLCAGRAGPQGRRDPARRLRHQSTRRPDEPRRLGRRYHCQLAQARTTPEDARVLRGRGAFGSRQGRVPEVRSPRRARRRHHAQG